jgi:RNA polymerase sigma-70 factor, ECF subfamily
VAFARTVRDALHRAESPELDRELDEALARARATWPDLSVDDDRFARQLARVLEDGTLLADVDLADLYLAFACAEHDAAALATLDRALLAPLRGTIARLGLADTSIDEVLQLVREELLVAESPKILSYSGRGSLAGWLRAVAVRKGLRLIRQTPKHDALDPDHGTMTDDPELAYMKRHYGEVFQRGFTTALAQLQAKDRLLLKQRFRHRMGVEDLGAHYGVHAGTISRWVQSARDALATLTRTAMMAELGVGAADLSSILRLIQSQLDVTLSAV